MRIRILPLGRPTGWLLIAVLLLGAGTSIWAYRGLSAANDVPAIPAMAEVVFLQRSGSEDSKQPDVSLEYNQTSRATDISVCVKNDAMLFFRTDNPIPDGATLPGDEEDTFDQSIFIPGKGSDGKGKGFFVPAKAGGPDYECRRYRVDGEWMSNTVGARTALRAPFVEDCGLSDGDDGPIEYDFGRYGVWQARQKSGSDCNDVYTQLGLAETGIVSSGPEPAAEDDSALVDEVGSVGNNYYPPESRIQIEDTQLAGKLARSQTWRGVVLGVGLTFLAEGILGIAASLTNPVERKRTWRRRRLWED
jgi:hypothetical protein